MLRREMKSLCTQILILPLPSSPISAKCNQVSVPKQGLRFSMQIPFSSSMLIGATSSRLEVSNVSRIPRCSPINFIVISKRGLIRREGLRQHVWSGYWIGPEDADGWGFVEAFIVSSQAPVTREMNKDIQKCVFRATPSYRYKGRK